MPTSDQAQPQDRVDAAMRRRWPGKSAVVAGAAPYPAVCHMLDVAAVAEVMTSGREEAVWAPLLIALHDLGKISALFRRMILRESTSAQPFRHWEVTEALLRHEPIEARLCAHLNIGFQALRVLVAAIAGHHGRPPAALEDDFYRMREAAGAEALADAEAFVLACLDLWPDASLNGMKARQAKGISWRLAGLCSAADWVGSNAAWFEPVDRGGSLAAHLALARKVATQAVLEAGLRGAGASAGPLFDFSPRAMQVEAARIPLRDGPMLAILEDETGAGKTEAAFLLAQRMLLAGKGNGVFVALPTMATADAMFARAKGFVRRLFEAPPSLTLAHGRSALSDGFREVQGAAIASDDAVCSPWLADDRRRALLADVGVGTVDQALLGVLPTKFATLRLWGLAPKVLIVDEVHELGDPYMEVELAGLLRMHALGGGSAILLSATLPLGLRERLSRAFETGAGRAHTPDPDPAYPALSVPGGARAAPAALPAVKGVVGVERVADAQSAVELLRKAASRGAACVWIRNAVDEAIAAVELLRANGLTADLLHARFALADRKRHERAAMSRFGRHDGGRAGLILVATQVLESSLDLDFDMMVSDLAPMAALVQRAGRLWRHMDLRTADARPVLGPTLHVVSPDPVEVGSDDWLRAALGRGAHVYPIGLQWLTARALFATGAIDAPRDLRRLIEAVHGDDTPELPEPLASRDGRDYGEARAAEGLGRQNVVRIADGYRDGGGGADDRDYPTRLGQPVRRLLLARRVEGRLVPYADGGARAEAEMLSEVSASERRLAKIELPDQQAAAILALTEGWPDWKRREVFVCPVDETGRICTGLRYDPLLGLLFEA